MFTSADFDPFSGFKCYPGDFPLARAKIQTTSEHIVFVEVIL